MRTQALFNEKSSCNLVIADYLQVVDAFYAFLQIRCTAHNLQIAGIAEYKIILHKDLTFFWLQIAVCSEWKVNIYRRLNLPLGVSSGVFAF